ncbi:hypothetical protein GBA52_019943 [Prunus armeniaca]|nr:hypothetical protein GBA52_019943 [Prunus armeniaca]
MSTLIIMIDKAAGQAFKKQKGSQRTQLGLKQLVGAFRRAYGGHPRVARQPLMSWRHQLFPKIEHVSCSNPPPMSIKTIHEGKQSKRSA